MRAACRRRAEGGAATRAAPRAAARRRARGAGRAPPRRGAARPPARPRVRDRARARPRSSDPSGRARRFADEAARTLERDAAAHGDREQLGAEARGCRRRPRAPHQRARSSAARARISARAERQGRRCRSGLPTSVAKRVEPERDAERDRHERQPSHQPRGAGRLGERDAHVVGGLLRVAQRGRRARAGCRRAARRPSSPPARPPRRRATRPRVAAAAAARRRRGGGAGARHRDRGRSGTPPRPRRRAAAASPGLGQVAPGRAAGATPACSSTASLQHGVGVVDPASSLVAPCDLLDPRGVPLAPSTGRPDRRRGDATPSAPRSTCSTSPIALTT